MNVPRNITAHDGDTLRFETMYLPTALRHRGRDTTAYVWVGDFRYRGFARCHPDDLYNAELGTNLALARAMAKASEKILALARQEIDELCDQQRQARELNHEVHAGFTEYMNQTDEQLAQAVLASPHRSLWERYGFGRRNR